MDAPTTKHLRELAEAATPGEPAEIGRVVESALNRYFNGER